MWSACTLRQHLWAKRDFSGKLCSIRACGQQGQFANDNWGLGTLDIVHTGPAATLDIHTNVEQQAQWLIEQDPDYLLTYPSVVVALIEHFRQQSLQGSYARQSVGSIPPSGDGSYADRRSYACQSVDGSRPLSRLREVRTFGEVLEPHVRRLCREMWNVPVSDVYSTQEIGYIAIQCPEVEEHYHVQAENVLLEVLDDQGRLCGPGEVGRVVITTLQNFAMPLIRYDIGDYAEVGPPCSCGRGLPVLRRILGRKRNMFILPNGQRRWPCMDTNIEGLDELTCVRQFQVVQRSLTELDVNLRVTRPLTADEQAVVRNTLVSGLGYPFQITIHYVDSIARSPSGKFEDYRCDIVADRSADPKQSIAAHRSGDPKLSTAPLHTVHPVQAYGFPAPWQGSCQKLTDGAVSDSVTDPTQPKQPQQRPVPTPTSSPQ